MEDVLELYAESHDPRRPLVCFDEKPVQLLAHVREPLPPAPGRPAREDSEYERRGTACVMGFLDPKGGARCLEASERRTRLDFARCMRRLVDEIYPEAERVRVVLDNLNTHEVASLYEAFPPEEARRIARRLELHFTPKHGSWLNAIELEFAALDKQCLDRRIGSLEELRSELAAWEAPRNRERTRVRWTFGVPDARERLKGLYPANQS